MQQGIEKRETRRVNYSVDVEIEWGSSTLRARTRNVSLGGMLLEMADPLWIGAEFAARISLAEGPLQTHCIVRRAVPEVGNAVEFVEMNPQDRGRLRQLIDSLPY